MLSRVLRVCLLETLKQVRQKFRADALASIADRYLCLGICTFKPYLDPASFRCELDGVGEQIPDHLLEPCCITCHYADCRIKLSR